MPPLNMEALALTPEQEFNLIVYKEQVKGLAQEHAQEFLVEVLRQLMIKDNVIKSLMRNVING
jgi:hypothetical protein